MQFGIFKLIRILESEPNTCFTAAEYMNLYTTTYNMCTQKPPHEYSEQLYERYKRVFKDYLTGTVCSPCETGLHFWHPFTSATFSAGTSARQESGIRARPSHGALFGVV